MTEKQMIEKMYNALFVSNGGPSFVDVLRDYGKRLDKLEKKPGLIKSNVLFFTSLTSIVLGIVFTLNKLGVI